MDMELTHQKLPIISNVASFFASAFLTSWSASLLQYAEFTNSFSSSHHPPMTNSRLTEAQCTDYNFS